MANSLYVSAHEGFLGGDIDWDSTITAALVRGYTPNLDTHSTLSDVTGAGGTVVSSTTLTGKTKTGGVADATDITFPTVTAGAAIQHLLIYQQSNSRLIALIDTTLGVTLPVIPNGGNITVQWDSGINKIFRI
jgi:hypothetical protein